MPGIADHHSSSFTKMLLIGDSGGGKTGALASLAAAGYKLRILDCDNGLDILKNVLRDKHPKCLGPHEDGTPWVHYVTVTENLVPVGGKAMIQGGARAWTKAMNTMSKWEDELGKPSEWGAGTVLVVDSLSLLCRYAMNHVLGLNSRLNQPPWQSDWGVAQGLIRDFLSMLYSDGFATNVVVNCHVTYIGREVEHINDKGEIVSKEEDVKGYPASLGRALSPEIGRYFNHALMARTQGQGAGARRFLFTNTQGLVELKTSAPGRVKAQYPIETGLADYFKEVRG